ncbi:MAG: hypothetical protein LBT40_17390 [Deltaproteobacteria bacterium]|nr:hypothetical protein [Deltaproteobacteria bacterium]
MAPSWLFFRALPAWVRLDASPPPVSGLRSGKRLRRAGGGTYLGDGGIPGPLHAEGQPYGIAPDGPHGRAGIPARLLEMGEVRELLAEGEEDRMGAELGASPAGVPGLGFGGFGFRHPGFW